MGRKDNIKRLKELTEKLAKKKKVKKSVKKKKVDADINKDGKVDEKDIEIVKKQAKKKKS
ncbi:MAG: hypothetical protein HWN81_00035 [Candidatus Lokiarchaeota archaeon]|nr:hypothetical protein [Candidatus Lokiarchaeota archaeon]